VFETFQLLPRPPERDSFAVDTAHADWCRVGRSHEGFPVLLLRFSSEKSTPERRVLSLIEYRPPVEVNVVGGGSIRVAILECKTNDAQLAAHFFRVAQTLILDDPATQNEEIFTRALDRLISLFRALQKPGSRSVQGVWAELALIAGSASPQDAILAWHSNPHELYDFSNGSVRLEVKSTAKPFREHEFLLDQLGSSEPGMTLIASMLLKEDPDGDSIGDLVEAIRLLTLGAPGVHDRVIGIVAESLGQGWRASESVRFNVEAARDALRVFLPEQIPTIPQPLPIGVANVRFTAKLDGLSHLELSQAREMAALYAALLPEPS